VSKLSLKLEQIFFNLNGYQQGALLRFIDTIMKTQHLQELLNESLAILPDIIRGDSFVIQTYFGTEQKPLILTKNMPAELIVQFQKIRQHDPNYQFMLSKKQTLTNRSRFKDAEWQKTESFKLVFEPIGAFHFTALPILNGDDVKATIHIHRSKEHPFTKQEIQCCDLLSQYLSKALDHLFKVKRTRANDDNLMKLTRREKEVLQLLGKGYKDTEISSELGITNHTVRDHLKKIYSKLDVSTRSEALIKGIRYQLLEVD